MIRSARLSRPHRTRRVRRPARPRPTTRPACCASRPSTATPIVFTYAGDLYTVPADGRRRPPAHQPRRLRDVRPLLARRQADRLHRPVRRQHRGLRHARPRAATPKRLTYTATLGRDDVSDRMGPNNIVMGWKHDGKHILFRSRMRSFNDFIGQLYTVPRRRRPARAAAAAARRLLLATRPTASKLAYNRVFREFRTWKRYRGGMADDVWIYDFDTKKTEQHHRQPGPGHHPMWHGDKIYFLSDRDDEQADEPVRPSTRRQEDASSSPTSPTSTSSSPRSATRPSSSRTAAGSTASTWRPRRPSKVPIRILEDRVGGRGGLTNVSKNVTSLRDLARRQAAPVRRPRRRVHRARQGRARRAT